MTNKQLINKLQSYPEDMEVFTLQHNGAIYTEKTPKVVVTNNHIQFL